MSRSGIVVKHAGGAMVFRCLECVLDPAAPCSCLFDALAYARTRTGGHVRTYSHDGRLLASTKLAEARVHESRPMPRRRAA